MQIVMLLCGSSPENRRANLRDYLIRKGVEVDHPEKYDGLVVLVCGRCGRSVRYATIEDIPVEDLKCECGRTWMIYVIGGTPTDEILLCSAMAVSDRTDIRILSAKSKPVGLEAISGAADEESESNTDTD